ncbi:TrkH family potassium uptake protein [halophilic archaeon]|nr:TrkH family potassium uptake protein [halophilic archaeon]
MAKSWAGRTSSSLATIFRDVGGLVLIIGGLLLIPLFVALVYWEPYSGLAFLISAGITGLAGGVIYWVFNNAPNPKKPHAMVIAAFGWLACAIFGALPFIFAAYLTPVEVMNSYIPAGAAYTQSSMMTFRNPLHAVFESMSGYTGTGLTMSVHEPSLTHSLLFYRSIMQFIGGVGVIVLSLAILRTPKGTSGVLLYISEAHEEKLRPNIIETVRSIWKIYILITATVAVYLFLGTLLILPEYGIAPTVFDAINHAMTGQSAGGFSTLDNSIAGYNSSTMEILYIPPMVLAAVALPLYYQLFSERDWRDIWRNPQPRWLIILSIMGSIILTSLLLGVDTVSNPVREGVFQYISALSTTGWQTSNIGAWSGGAVIFIVAGAMVIGGSVGATVGGIKIVRAYLIGRGISWQVYRVFLPEHALETFKIGNDRLDRNELTDEFTTATVFSILYVIVLIASVLIIFQFMGQQYTLADAIFESASAQGNVGLSSGMTHPAMSPIVEMMLLVQMWIGRLEIIPLLVFFRALIAGTSFH